MASKNKNSTSLPEPLGLISLNANGLGQVNKWKNLISWLNKYQNGEKKIILLQETHTTEKIEKLWTKEWGNRYIAFLHGTSGSKGVAMIFPKHMNYNVEEVIRSKEGRFVVVICTIDDNRFCIANCYAPTTNNPKGQLKWLAEIQEILQLNIDSTLIVGGDLNDVFIPQLDRYKCRPGTTETEYVKAWKTLCSELNLTDVWRILNPDKRCYTWRQGGSLATLKQSRLDYWLISVHAIYDLSQVDIKSSIRSDHSIIDLDFYKMDTPKRGPSFWRFNASLLKDIVYIEKIKEGFREAMIKYQDIEDKGLKWDLIKMELRSSTICYSKIKAKAMRENIKETMIKVDKLEKEININPSEEKLIEYKMKAKNSLRTSTTKN
jgi:exonuclease III